MTRLLPARLAAAAVAGALLLPAYPAAAAEPVTLDNFKRVESDLYFAKFVRAAPPGEFSHARAPAAIDAQDVIRMNRDTLYSSAVLDLAAGPATVTLPDAGARFMSMQVIDEDHYTPMVIYEPGEHRFTQEQIGTRYVLMLVRTFVDPNDPADLDAVHALQDAMTIEQGPGATFEIPDWDVERAAALRKALNDLSAASGGLDSARMFGARDEVDPVQHLIGAAAGWGGNPARDALYVGVVPEKNDGETVYEMSVGEVPVDGFWSISVYDADGFFARNDLERYSLNNVTAAREADGSVKVRFGGCTAERANCLPITPGWSYVVRLYRPHAEILEGAWTFPEATPAQ
ncbi:DUF1254 domain-containing protein [Albimonas pacifica]|uniref:Carboxylesterase n=1 Tax=Albimonas pacifica TaxID=1114924 RepID=A0A1I3F9Z7_9RHOB|nr:DUF1254 domain-containing protein [Albimonas pacifica]SFI08035.1 Protein of unknown function [Albimonas pacifica]